MSAPRAVFLVFCFFAVPSLFPCWTALDSSSSSSSISGSGTHDGWAQRRSSVAPMLSGARAQACVPFRGSPGTAHKCDTFLVPGTNVFLAPGQTYESVDAAVGNYTRAFGAFVPPDCRTAGLRLLCLSYFLPCDFSTSTGLAVLPPCRSVCEEMTLACYAFLESQNQLNQLPNCDLITNVTGTPLPAFLPVGCAYGPTDAVVPYSQADCPYPLNWDPQAAPGASDMCVAPCPNLFYSSGEWVAIRVVAYVFSFISLVINLFLCITWSLNPKKRRFPASVLLYISLCFIFFTGFQFLGVFFEPNSITCTKDWPPKPVGMDSAGDNGGWGMGCIFQAMVFSYLTIAQILWWLALNINLFVLLVLEIRQERFMKLHKWYHLMCWGLPMISLVLLLATKKVGGSIGSPYCQFYSGDGGRSWWDWAFVFGPTIPLLVVGMVLLCVSVIKLMVLKFKRKESSLTSHLVRLMSMVIYFLINIAITYSFRIYAEVRYDDIQRAVEQQVQCSLISGTECEIEGGISYTYFFFVVLATATIGDAVFLFLGTTKETFGFWVRLIHARQAEEGFLTHAWAMVKGHTSDSSSSGGSSPPASNPSNGSSLDFALASLSSKPSTNL